MSKAKIDVVTVVKTDKLDRFKMSRIVRKFNVPPIDIRDLLDGLPVLISKSAVEELENLGFVKRTKEKAPKHRRNFTTEPDTNKLDITIENVEESLTDTEDERDLVEEFSRIKFE